MAAVRQNGHVLRYADSDLQGSRTIVITAVRRNGYALRWAPPHLQSDYKVVIAAVRQNGHALQFAAPELRANRNISMVAINQDARAFKFVGDPALQADRDMVLDVVRRNGSRLRFASPDLKGDEHIASTAVRSCPASFKYAANDLRNDCDFIAQHAIRIVRDFRIGTRLIISGRTLVDRCPVHNFLSDFICCASDAVKQDLVAISDEFDSFEDALACHRVFFQTSHASFMEFLCCGASKSAAAAGKPVTSLNLDKATTETVHRHIAEYVGMPLDQQVERARLVKHVIPVLQVFGNMDNLRRHFFPAIQNSLERYFFLETDLSD